MLCTGVLGAKNGGRRLQLIIDVGALRSMHALVKEKPGRRLFREIKTMKEDAAGVEKMGEEIKARYSKLFGV